MLGRPHGGQAQPPDPGISDLVCRRGGRTVFDRLSFAMARGELISLAATAVAKPPFSRARPAGPAPGRRHSLARRPISGKSRTSGAARISPGWAISMAGDIFLSARTYWSPNGCAGNPSAEVASRAWWRSTCRGWRPGRSAACRPTSGGGHHLPACCSRGPCGCSTSHQRARPAGATGFSHRSQDPSRRRRLAIVATHAPRPARTDPRADPSGSRAQSAK